MKWLCRGMVFLFVAGLLARAGPAYAVVRNDDTVGDPADFPAAVKVGVVGGKTGPSGLTDFFCSGTVIGGGAYVITAAHCIGGTAGINGANWVFEDQFGVQIMGEGIVKVHATADIAIISLNGTFDDFYELFMGDVNNQLIDFVGFGLSSDAAGGDGGGPGTGMSELPYGTPRQGSNVIDQPAAAGEVAFDFDLAGGVEDGVLRGASEATTFGGDSGMGYLVQVGIETQLLAVHSGILTMPGLNVDQAVSIGTSVPFYKQWIQQQIVPEPSTLALLGIGAVGMAGYGWRRRKRAA